MPRISQFYGIAVYMYYRDHAPPHFHAIYGEFEAEIEIANARLLEGELPRRARSLVKEWARAHRERLQRNWDLAWAGQPLDPLSLWNRRSKPVILRIVQANVCGPHLLRLAFNDGVRKTVDVSALLVGAVFEPLRDPVYFARGELDPVCGTVVWPNGADFAPEALYELAEVETSTVA